MSRVRLDLFQVSLLFLVVGNFAIWMIDSFFIYKEITPTSVMFGPISTVRFQHCYTVRIVFQIQQRSALSFRFSHARAGIDTLPSIQNSDDE